MAWISWRQHQTGEPVTAEKKRCPNDSKSLDKKTWPVYFLRNTSETNDLYGVFHPEIQGLTILTRVGMASKSWTYTKHIYKHYNISIHDLYKMCFLFVMCWTLQEKHQDWTEKKVSNSFFISAILSFLGSICAWRQEKFQPTIGSYSGPKNL